MNIGTLWLDTVTALLQREEKLHFSVKSNCRVNSGYPSEFVLCGLQHGHFVHCREDEAHSLLVLSYYYALKPY